MNSQHPVNISILRREMGVVELAHFDAVPEPRANLKNADARQRKIWGHIT